MSREEVKAPTQYSLLSIFVTKALYEFDTDAEFSVEGRPAKLNVQVQMVAGVKLFKDSRGAFVDLDAKIIPDAKWQPYRLEVKIGGAFHTPDGTIDELMNFCKVAAPSILFPYIREAAHRLTMDAPGGPVRLDPMNVSMLLNQNPWSEAQVSVPDPSVVVSAVPVASVPPETEP